MPNCLMHALKTPLSINFHCMLCLWVSCPCLVCCQLTSPMPTESSSCRSSFFMALDSPSSESHGSQDSTPNHAAKRPRLSTTPLRTGPLSRKRSFLSEAIMSMGSKSRTVKPTQPVSCRRISTRRRPLITFEPYFPLVLPTCINHGPGHFLTFTHPTFNSRLNKSLRA